MSSDNREWKPLFSFGIDDCELYDLESHECFTLGYELALVREVYAVREDGWSGPVHSEKVQRIHRALKEAKRSYSLEWMPNDSSESWMQLKILPK